ncbi:hypothetical protein NSQ50_02085 [Paenibacillus sp. FSL R10-2788]|uniref:hypothetical protein n=1 Tax=Paenibacillus sp. FSL R10-2788 TaxID=2954694 RepID=UPI0030F6CF84
MLVQRIRGNRMVMIGVSGLYAIRFGDNGAKLHMSHVHTHRAFGNGITFLM